MADTTSAQKDAWKKKNMTQFCVRFHNVNDADIIERLRSEENRANYIRQLIRADIEKKKLEY